MDWDLRDAYEEAMAEIDRLRACQDMQEKNLDHCGAEIDRLRMENAQLRERLSQIAEVVRIAPSKFFQHRALEKIADLIKGDL